MSDPVSTDAIIFRPIARDTLNLCLEAWGHRMGPVRRPRAGWSHGLSHGGALVGVVASDALIRARVAGFSRAEAIELSRLCAARRGATSTASFCAFGLPSSSRRSARAGR